MNETGGLWNAFTKRAKACDRSPLLRNTSLTCRRAAAPQLRVGRSGVMTGVYLLAMMIGATAASALAVPVRDSVTAAVVSAIAFGGLWLIGLVTALMTAYYMSRQVFLVFYGGERWKKGADAKSEGEAEAEPAVTHERVDEGVLGKDPSAVLAGRG